MPRKRVSKKVSQPAAQQEASLLKSEIRYFKGMTILLFVMLTMVFFTFSALFAAMYANSVETNTALIEAYNGLIGR
jgi:hypothetical protein